jgi:hypothetical protein
VGITPDVVVEEPKLTPVSEQMPADADEETIRESDLPHHFTNGKGGKEIESPAPELKTKHQSMAPQLGKPSKDVQLDKAIDLLKHWKSFQEQLAKSDSTPAPN